MANRQRRGASSELIACAWLLQQGYEVFRNVSPQGPIDLVAFKNGKTTFFDVKSTNGYFPSNILTPKQKALGVLILAVDPDGKCEILISLPPKGSRKRLHNHMGQFIRNGSKRPAMAQDCENPIVGHLPLFDGLSLTSGLLKPNGGHPNASGPPDQPEMNGQPVKPCP